MLPIAATTYHAKQYVHSLKLSRQTIGVAAPRPMDVNEVLDSLAHEFLLVKMKRELDTVQDPEELRRACVLLIDLMEKQKAMFKTMIYSFIDENPEQSELFE